MLARLGKVIRRISRLGAIGGTVGTGLPTPPELVDRFGIRLQTRAGEDLLARSPPHGNPS